MTLRFLFLAGFVMGVQGVAQGDMVTSQLQCELVSEDGGSVFVDDGEPIFGRPIGRPTFEDCWNALEDFEHYPFQFLGTTLHEVDCTILIHFRESDYEEFLSARRHEGLRRCWHLDYANGNVIHIGIVATASDEPFVAYPAVTVSN